MTITIIIIIIKGDQIAFINDREENVARAAGVVISVISFIFVCFLYQHCKFSHAVCSLSYQRN